MIVNKGATFVLCILFTILACGCNPDYCNDEDDFTDSTTVTPESTEEISRGIPQGQKFNRDWVMSVEAGANFVGLYTDSAGKTYAINNYGGLYSNSENQGWKRESITDDYTQQLLYITGYGSDVYVAGPGSALFHKKGANGWVRERFAGDTLRITAMYAYDNEVWVADGFDGSIWHRSKAGVWEPQLVKNSPLYALYGQGTELWALGRKAVYHKKPDTRWIMIPVTEEQVDFYTIYQYEKNVWVMGSNGNIFYNNGREHWKKETGDKATPDISYSYGIKDEVYAAGKDGLILHRLPGGQWIKEENEYQDISASCMYGRNHDIWIGGSDGFIFHKSGNGAWRKETGPNRGIQINKLSGWGNTVFAAGHYATLLTRSPDNTWNKANSIMPDTPLTSIFKYSKDVLAGGKNGILYHRLQDGRWQLEDSRAGDVVFADLYESDQNIYLVGSNGSIAWRHKTDTTWTSQRVCAANLMKIYGYGNDIWIAGTHSTLLHKKENDSTWQAINNGISEVDFIDIYGWNGQIWALGSKDQRGIIFHKDSSNNWTKEELHNRVDHFHALYGRADTVWAVGASGDWGIKNKLEDNYQGTIICKEGNKPWISQIDHAPGVHFNTINGQGNDIYALGNQGSVYHKNGNNEWEKEDTYQNNESLKKLIFFKGLVMLSNDGFVYRENEDRNYIRINRTNKIINAVAMGNDLYCIGGNAIFRITPTQDKYPVVDNVKYTLTPFINPNSIKLNFVLQRPETLKSTDDYQIEIYAKPYNEGYNDNNWVRPNASKLVVKANHQTNSLLVSTNIEVAKSLRVIPDLESANKICLRVDVTTKDGLAQECFILKDSNGNSFITLDNNFWLKNKLWMMIVSVIVLYYACWFLLCFSFPLLFLRIYEADILQQLISLSPHFRIVSGIINILFPLKKLATTARVQNAWVMAFAATAASKYEKSEITQFRSYYVSLPVKTDNPVMGTLIEKPDESILDMLFNNDRSIIQIIGPGGAGKTSLAVAIGRWMIKSTRNRESGRMPRLPILLETDSTDLLKDITRMLRSWQNDYTIHEGFVKVLLKSQRLVVIVDSLSERPVAIQEYFKTLHGDTPVNALIITARQPIDLQVKEGVYLYPSPLNSNNLLHFITTYLNIYPNHPLLKSREQLAFAEKIVSIIEGNNNRVPVTPILVKLIIEIALKKEGDGERTFQIIMDEMPDSIPDVYYQYLVHVNPKNPATVNYLPKQEMLKVAELLGRISLGNNFRPQDFLEETARKALQGNTSHDPIQRLIDNGVLTRRESLATSYLRFNIDTLAEYLAASKLYDDNNTSPEQLSAFTAIVNSLSNEAQEFKMAFIQISDYKLKHG